MTRHSMGTAFVSFGILCAFVVVPTTVVAQAASARPRPATTVAQPAGQAVAQPAAEAAAQSRAATQFVRPVGAAERAAVSNQLAKGDCVQSSYVMSVSRMFDTRPLERPKALVILKGDRDATMGRLSTLLRANGFAEVSSNIDSGELLVTRPDTVSPGARDDILVWADGQAGDANRIRIYLQYGRFEPFFGSTTPERVQTPPDEMQKRIGQVRQAIINLAAGDP